MAGCLRGRAELALPDHIVVHVLHALCALVVCVCLVCERLGAIVDVGFSHWLTCGVGCPLHRTMPHDITARIEYSEKYQDDTYEYR